MPQTGTQTCTDQQSERIFIAFSESSKRMPKAAAAADDRVDQGSLWRKRRRRPNSSGWLECPALCICLCKGGIGASAPCLAAVPVVCDTTRLQLGFHYDAGGCCFSIPQNYARAPRGDSSVALAAATHVGA